MDDPSSDALHRRVQEAITAGGLEPWTDEAFDALSAALFEHQFRRCAPLRRFWGGRGARPETFSSWLDVPPVPTDVFRYLDLCTFPPEDAAAVFRTSGTTVGTRGRHLLRRVDTYEASLAPGFDRFLGGGDRPRILVLAPPPDQAPDSSLSHMLGWAVARRGGEGSGFFWREGPDLEAASAAVGEGPVLVLGTARALLALVDGPQPWSLPAGSRVMETGGFKGASVDLEPGRFRERLAARLGVPTWAVVSEYGMTELGSQGYQPCWSAGGDLGAWPPLRSGRSADASTPPSAPSDPCVCPIRGGSSVRPRRGSASRSTPSAAAARLLGEREGRRFVFPPWCRVRAMDPSTLSPLPDGERGLLCFWDLSNVDSALAVQCGDVGVVHGDGVELLGRAPGATARGCSLAVDEILRGVR